MKSSARLSASARGFFPGAGLLLVCYIRYFARLLGLNL
jgi:hypothetical protein